MEQIRPSYDSSVLRDKHRTEADALWAQIKRAFCFGLAKIITPPQNASASSASKAVINNE